MSDTIVVVAAKRSPIGGLLGQLSHLSAIDLATATHQSAIKSSQLESKEIDSVWMGCVLSAGLGQAPARQTAVKAGLSNHCAAVTLNKVCGSGLQAIWSAHDSIRLGQSKIALCGGMESMSNAPYLLPKARQGYRLGDASCLDHLWCDGLEDAYDQDHALMGCFAQASATALNLSRGAQDDYARTSMQWALNAQAQGAFINEIVAIGDLFQDEQPQVEKLEKLARLKPIFAPNGTITAGNSSSIADGAASLILMSASEAKARNIKPLAKILGFAQFAHQPAAFPTAPIDAVKRLLAQLAWQASQVDLWEINEAFAMVSLACMQALDIDRARVNVNGGACALGHPIGASGARIVVTLIHALQARGLTTGIATLCIGGGEALAIAVENLC